MRGCRKRICYPLVLITLLIKVPDLVGVTLYVSPDSTNAVPPYSTWATAATNIQPAVDAAIDGDEILVTNGVYETGGQIVLTAPTNRLVITKQVLVRSVNGPDFTVIRGYQVPGAINGDSAVRCVYLDLGTLSGFTLTNGASGANYTTNLTPRNCGGGVFCGSTNAVLTNCVIAGNSSFWEGGGAYGGKLFNCCLTSNIAGNDHGGGAGWCILYNCTLAQNAAGWNGGGAWHCTLYNCILTNNSAGVGGGAWESTLYNCVLSGNSAGSCAGGAYGSTLFNCLLSKNSGFVGGGVYGSTNAPCCLYSCTLTGNSAPGYGGGADGDYYTATTLNNCVAYFNISARGANYVDTGVTINFCCTTPLPTSGVGNITTDPLFVNYNDGNLRLQSNSPCINSGNNAYVSTISDLDGNPRIVSGTLDIGAYEYQGTGSLISYSWLQQYNLPTDGSADFIDSDGDGMNNWQEWVCGTCPTNAQSALRLLSAQPAGTTATVSWESVAGVSYFLERSQNISSPFEIRATNIVGQSTTISYQDTNAIGAGPFIYRVGVHHP